LDLNTVALFIQKAAPKATSFALMDAATGRAIGNASRCRVTREPTLRQRSDFI
jgi:hypothetical protein